MKANRAEESERFFLFIENTGPAGLQVSAQRGSGLCPALRSHCWAPGRGGESGADGRARRGLLLAESAAAGWAWRLSIGCEWGGGVASRVEGGAEREVGGAYPGGGVAWWGFSIPYWGL